VKRYDDEVDLILLPCANGILLTTKHTKIGLKILENTDCQQFYPEGPEELCHSDKLALI